MAEEELGFDLSQKKKSQKKKPFDLSALEGNDTGGDPSGQAEGDDKGELPEDLEELLAMKKKKSKKSKKYFNLDDIENALPDGESGNKTEETEKKEADETKEDAAITEDMDLDFLGAKKKKKRKKVIFDESVAGEDQAGGAENGQEDADNDLEFLPEGTGAAPGTVGDPNMPWLGSDRDYSYDELLQHVFNIIKQKNPDIVGEKKRLVMRPPQVLRVGTKKTSFANFLEICKLLHRQPKHMQAFLLAELGTSGSVDANNQLIIKGRFQQKQIESVLRRYIKEYVACQTCRSPETILQKDTRLFFLQCETCGSRRSVASIKSGYQAQVGKRAATRAKAN